MAMAIFAAELDKRDGWPSKEEDELTGGGARCSTTSRPARSPRKEDWLGPLHQGRSISAARADGPHERHGRSARPNPFGGPHQRDLQLRHRAISTCRTCSTHCPRRTSWSRTAFLTDDDFPRLQPSRMPCGLWGVQKPALLSRARRVAKEARGGGLKATPKPGCGRIAAASGTGFYRRAVSAR